MNTFTSSFLHTLVASAMLSALVSSFAQASSFRIVPSAEASTTPPQAIVKFGDLDISTPQGATALFGRIRSAAVNVCPWPTYGTDNMADQLNKACRQKAIADAVMKVNRPALSAVYEAKYGKLQTFVLAMNQRR
jgi:UrcA family protein